MAPMAYSGTHLVNGIASSPSACVTGFDQVAFMMGSSASIFNVDHFLCFLIPVAHDLFSLQAVNGPNGNFTGFDGQDGDVIGMQFLYQQLSSRVQSRSFNVANWPNVSGSAVVYQRPMSYVAKGISRRQPRHVPGFLVTVAFTRGWWFESGANTSRVAVHKSEGGRCCRRCGRKRR